MATLDEEAQKLAQAVHDFGNALGVHATRMMDQLRGAGVIHQIVEAQAAGETGPDDPIPWPERPDAPAPVEPPEDWETRRTVDIPLHRLAYVRLQAAHADLHAAHRRSRKAERTLTKSNAKLRARVDELEERGRGRDNWKADKPIATGDVIYLHLRDVDEPIELRVRGISWKRDQVPPWTLRAELELEAPS